MRSGIPFVPRNGFVVMNAAGCACTTFKQLRNLDNAQVSAVVTKSSTIYPRDGNTRPRYWEYPGGSINSNGLCNLSFEKYMDYANMRPQKHPFIISLAGDPMDIKIMLNYASGQTPKNTYFEVNLTCPNVQGYTEPFQTRLHDILIFCKRNDFVIGLKMPVIFDLGEIRSVGYILNKFTAHIWYISCSNSLPNGLILDDNHDPVILGGKNGLGGIGGEYLKPFSLMNVREFASVCPNICILGCGGISCRKDIDDYLSCGAEGVQIGTHLMKNGVECFGSL